MRPQRVRAIGSSSGWVTLKKPCSETSMTRRHCSADMPAIGASSWMPALLTTAWTGPASSRAAIAAPVASPSATSKATASALPPPATTAATTPAARARLPLAWTMTWKPSAASWRQIAPPRSPLPPVTRARRNTGEGLLMPRLSRHPRRACEHHGRPALGEQHAAMADAEGVLLAGLAFDQQFGLAFQRAGELIDARAVELHAAQRHQHPGAHAAPGPARAQAAVHGHRLCAVLAQVHGAQHAAAAQRVRRVAVVARVQPDACGVEVDDLVPQAHGVLVRYQAEDFVAGDHRGGSSPWCRDTSSASTKLDSTPMATVLPIARSTGIEDSASRLNTSRVIRLHTSTACRVRSWSSRRSPACSKNRA